MTIHQETSMVNEALLGDMQRVAGYFTTATEEVALEIGGEELVKKIGTIGIVGEDLWPNPAALEVLETLRPGSAEACMSRTEILQDTAHANDIAALEVRSRERPESKRTFMIGMLRSQDAFGAFRGKYGKNRERR